MPCFGLLTTETCYGFEVYSESLEAFLEARACRRRSPPSLIPLNNSCTHTVDSIGAKSTESYAEARPLVKVVNDGLQGVKQLLECRKRHPELAKKNPTNVAKMDLFRYKLQRGYTTTSLREQTDDTRPYAHLQTECGFAQRSFSRSR